MNGYTPQFPPCPYCGGKVTGASMQGEFDPGSLYKMYTEDTVPPAIPMSYWVLEPCNHKAIDYTITVQFDPAVVDSVKPKGPGVHVEPAGPPQGGHAMVIGSHWYAQGKGVVGGAQVVSDLQDWLPGLSAVVKCPASYNTACGLPGCSLHPGPCFHESSVRDVIVHLNDMHRWTREQIADWLETLDVDLTFPTEKPVKRVLPFADPHDKLVIIGPTIAAIREEARRRRRDPRDVIEVRHGADGVRRLRGHHRLQYTVLPGTVLDLELENMLKAYAFREVGAEAPVSPVSDILKEVYAAKAKAMLEDELVAFKQFAAEEAVAFFYKKSAEILDQGSEGSSVGYAATHHKPQNPVEKALDHKASQSSHWAKFTAPTNLLKKKGH